MVRRTSGQDSIRGTWLWHAATIVAETDSTLDFAAAHGLNRIYLQVSRKVPVEAYQEFVRRAHTHGILVEALDGDPAWTLQDTHEGIQGFVAWVADYNGAAAEGSRFSAIHLDLEPYALPMWQQDRGAVLAAWRRTVTVFQATASDAGLYTCADLPFWLNTLSLSADSEPFGTSVLRRVDSATIMAYRTVLEGPNSVTAVARPLLQAAASLGRRALVAVDCSERGDAATSFRDVARLRACIEKLPRLYWGEAGYGGFAVNSCDAWRRLDARKERSSDDTYWQRL